jgi:hypothetical protein
MSPECCPDVSVTLSGCCRNQCPDVAEIRTRFIDQFLNNELLPRFNIHISLKYISVVESFLDFVDTPIYKLNWQEIERWVDHLSKTIDRKEVLYMEAIVCNFFYFCTKKGLNIRGKPLKNSVSYFMANNKIN